MAFSKTSLFSEDEQKLAVAAKALAHPARIRIMKILTDKNTCMCGDIVELLPLSQSTVSQHLKELKNAGLISGIISGPKVCYCANENSLQMLKKITITFIEKLISNNKSNEVKIGNESGNKESCKTKVC